MMNRKIICIVMALAVMMVSGCSGKLSQWNSEGAKQEDRDTYEELVTNVQLTLAGEEVHDSVSGTTITVEFGNDGVTVDGPDIFVEEFKKICGESFGDMKANNEAPENDGNYKIVVENGIVIREVEPEF